MSARPAPSEEPAVPLDVTPEVQNRPLRECVQAAVEAYFHQLSGHPPADLYRLVLAEVEAPLLATVLRHTGGNQSRAAAILGLNRGTLRKKLKQYGLNE